MSWDGRDAKRDDAKPIRVVNKGRATSAQDVDEVIKAADYARKAAENARLATNRSKR